MSAKGAKKIGFFQKLFCPDPTPNRKVKEVKKTRSRPPMDPPVDTLLHDETTDGTQALSTEPPSSSASTGPGNIREQVSASCSTRAGTTTTSSTQSSAVAKRTTVGAIVKGSTPACPSVKGTTRTASELSRRALPAKIGPTSGSRVRTGKAASCSTRPSKHPRTPGAKRSQRRRRKKPPAAVKVDTSRPLEYPTTPEMILAYHKAKPLLNKTEEWVIVSLNEYECMVDSLEVIRTMAKHSQFFEVEPEELCEEFFEYVEDVPSYDEVINADIWQEFRYEKYNW